MSDLQFILVIILQIIMPIVVLVFSKFLGAYSSKKGENLAVLEDNKKIISGIESIKYEFSKLQESDKSEKHLISARILSLNSQKDDLLFSIFEDSINLFNELRYPNPDIVGHKKENMIIWTNYYKSTVKSMDALLLRKSKLSVYFDNDDEIINSVDHLILPLIQSVTALINLVKQIDLIQRELLTISPIDGGIDESNTDNLRKYINQLHNYIVDQVKYVTSIENEFNKAKQIFLSEVQSYYGVIRSQFNVR